MADSRSNSRSRNRHPSWSDLREFALMEAKRHLPRDAVEDVVQEMLGELAPRIGRLSPRVEDFRAYVTVLVLNACRRWHRRQLARRPPISLDQMQEHGAQISSHIEPSASNDIQRAVLLGLIHRLRPRERRVLVRHFLHGQAVKEVARKLGLTPSGVRYLRGNILREARAIGGQSPP